MDTFYRSAAGLLAIEGKDIILREFVMADLEPFHLLTWQPEIHEYLPGWNVSREQREEWFVHYEIPENKRFLHAVTEGGVIGELRLRLGIVLKETGELIGWCCTGIKEELPRPNREIMYAVSKDHRGKGYTTQAAQAMIRYLFENTDVEALVAVARVSNAPSSAVIRKCGFDYQSVIEIDSEMYDYCRLDKKAWAARSRR